MYNTIYNPITGRNVNINSKLGKKILKTYIRTLYGGSDTEAQQVVAAREQLGLASSASFGEAWEEDFAYFAGRLKKVEKVLHRPKDVPRHIEDVPRHIESLPRVAVLCASKNSVAYGTSKKIMESYKQYTGTNLVFMMDYWGLDFNDDAIGDVFDLVEQTESMNYDVVIQEYCTIFSSKYHNKYYRHLLTPITIHRVIEKHLSPGGIYIEPVSHRHEMKAINNDGGSPLLAIKRKQDGIPIVLDQKWQVFERKHDGPTEPQAPTSRTMSEVEQASSGGSLGSC
jgi:hypothetical protein